MSDWIDALATHAATGAPAVLVTVVAVKGSAPRPPGTRMVVTAQGIDGTIGGGHLEWKAIDIARDLLGDDDGTAGGTALHRFPLGASLGQCCGGAVQLLFEPVHGSPPWLAALALARADGIDCALVTAVRGAADSGRFVVTATHVAGTLGRVGHDERAAALARAALADREGTRLVTLDTAAAEAGNEYFIDVVRQPEFRVVLFGAGHVGRALVNVLGSLACRITWVDSRDDAFPATVPDNVQCVATDTPGAEVAAAPAGAYFLVMTHSHALDEQLAEAILARADGAYFGLIGSVSKRRQFERRLESRGVPRARIKAMRCPIGIAGIAGKEPEVIAIAVTAELLQVRSGHAAAETVPCARRA
jgi:xanthine dehydrogenase accessory factor